MPHRSRISNFGFSEQPSLLRGLIRRISGQPRLLLAVDAVIGFLLLVFPFVMGGREAWGHWLLISSACLLSGLWCWHRAIEGGRLRLLSLEPLAAAGLLLVWFQTQPLPPSVLHRVSGEYQYLIPAWGGLQAEAAGSGGWRTVSLLPAETQHAFLMLAAYVMIGMVFAQRFSKAEDCYRILKIVAISGMLMAGFGVLQLVFSNDRFFWFYQHPWTGTREVLKGAFTNRNHFAQFLALALGPLLWWALVGRPQESAEPVMRRRGLGPAQGNHSQMDRIINPQLLLLLGGTTGVLLAVMLSLSRGGLLAAGIACCVVFSGLWRSGRIGSSLAFSMILMGVLCIAGIAVFGGQKLENRVDQLATLDADRIDESSARRSIWRADLNAAMKFPLLGTGIGSHRFVYPAYMRDLADYATCTFSHAESSWIHLLLEAGIGGVFCLGAGLLLIVWRLLRAFLQRTDATSLAGLSAAAAGLTGGVVHSVADFIWYVPAIVVTTLALTICALRLSAAGHTNDGLPLPRIAWLSLAVACVLFLTVVQPELLDRISGERWWNRYLIAANEARRAAAESGENSDETVMVGDSDEQPAARDSAAQGEAVPEQSAEGAGTLANYGDSESQQQDSAARIQQLRSQLTMLLRAWKERPEQPEVAVHIARRSLELFELLQARSDNPLPLVQIRDAVLSSGFESDTAMFDFLNRAFGKNMKLPLLADTMSRTALQLCPVQTEAWKNLITTGFLRDPQDTQHKRTIAQTLRLGRYDPAIRFSLGQSLFLSGYADEAVVQWNVAFHANRNIRRRICDALAPRFSAQALLTNFNPQLTELEDIFAAYVRLQSNVDIQRLIDVIIEHTRDVAAANFSKLKGSESTDGNETDELQDAVTSERVVELDSEAQLRQIPQLLLQAAAAAGRMQLTDQQELLLRRAATLAPESEAPRRALGLLLMERESFDEAERLFAACQDLNPGDTKLDDLRGECRRLQLVKQRRLRSVSERR